MEYPEWTIIDTITNREGKGKNGTVMKYSCINPSQMVPLNIKYNVWKEKKNLRVKPEGTPNLLMSVMMNVVALSQSGAIKFKMTFALKDKINEDW